MTKQDRNFLKEYELNFKTAVNSDYSRNMPTAAIQRLEQIYFNETSIALKTNYTCGHCVLKTLKTIGKWYSHCIMKLLKEAAKLYFNENGK